METLIERVVQAGLIMQVIWKPLAAGIVLLLASRAIREGQSPYDHSADGIIYSVMPRLR